MADYRYQMLVLLQRLIIPMSTAPICALPGTGFHLEAEERKRINAREGDPLRSCSLEDVKLGITVRGSFRDVCAKKRGWSWWIVKFEITPFGFNGAEHIPLSSARNLHETVVRDLARKWQWRREIYRHRYWTDAEERRVQMGAAFSKDTILGANRKNRS